MLTAAAAALLPDALAVMAAAAARILTPPPPIDMAAWAEANVIFGDGESQFPGALDLDRFPQLRRVLECLSPAHPAREVTLRASAQAGKTTLINIAVGAWFALDPMDVLMVQPTLDAATEWSRQKFKRARKQWPGLRRVFADERGRSATDTIRQIETADGRFSLRTVGANSPSGLSGTVRPRVILDDLSRFEETSAGDPEALAKSRTQGFEDIKFVRAGTPLVRGACRITRHVARGTNERYQVPCPHCGHRHTLDWENLKPSCEPEYSGKPYFSCPECGGVIEQHHRAGMMAAGEWVARNPEGDHPSFSWWMAEFPFKDWTYIQSEWRQARGDATREQVFYNDVLGLPFEATTDAPDWERLQLRAEAAEDAYPRGYLAPGVLLVCCGVDCQGDRVEVHTVGFGRNQQQWTVDYDVIPWPIDDERAQAVLDEYVRTRRWPNAYGRMCGLDMLAIDMNWRPEAVYQWAKRHPRERVVLVRGANSISAPEILQVKETDDRGKRRPWARRAYNLNVSLAKAAWYADLEKTDPQQRGFVRFPQGMPHTFYEQAVAEVGRKVRTRSGVVQLVWDLKAGQRNEVLDTTVYARAGAALAGWRSKPDEWWAALAAERETPDPAGQGELFRPGPAPGVARPVAAGPAAAPGAPMPAPPVSVPAPGPVRGWVNRLA